MAEEKEMSFFDKLGGVLSRAGEGAVDSLADSRSLVGSVIGGALQAGLETEGYQDKQESRDHERWKRDAQRKIMGNQLEESELDKPVSVSKREAAIQQNKEFMAGADFRAAQQAVGLQEANEYIANAPAREAQRTAIKMASEEYIADAPARESQRRFALQDSDNQFKAGEIDAISANFRKAMSSDPNHPFNRCTVQEQDAICSSPKLQSMFESQYYTRELIRTIGKDEVAWGRVSRAVENAGGEVVADKPGAFSLNIYGRKIPLNEQSIMGLNEQVKKAAIEELQSRATFSVNLTAGNPAGRAVAKRVNALMPYMQNDCVATSERVKKFVNDMPQEQKIYMLFNQTFDDFFDPTVSQETKNREIQAVVPFLSQLGFQLDMPDKDPTHARFLDQQNQRAYTLDEFRNFVKENDLGGQALDQQIAGAKAAAEKAERLTTLRLMRGTGSSLDGEEMSPEEQARNNQASTSLAESYSGNFIKLPQKQQESLRDVYIEAAKDAKLYGISDGNGELVDNLDKLRAFDTNWKKRMKDTKLDPGQFFSPVSNRILQLEIAEYEQKILDLDSSIQSNQNAQAYEDEAFGRRIPDNPRDDKAANPLVYRANHKKLEAEKRDLQSEIASRKKILQERGIGDGE